MHKTNDFKAMSSLIQCKTAVFLLRDFSAARAQSWWERKALFDATGSEVRIERLGWKQ